MTLKRMYPCSNHNQFMPEYVEHPEWCPWCRGTMEWEGDADFYNYEGEFNPIDYETIGTELDDYTVYVNCACGRQVFLSEGGDVKACDCGRVFRLNVSIVVDESHIGEIDWLLEESKRLNEEFFARWKDKSE